MPNNKTPGTYRIDDHRPVPFRDALPGWIKAARSVLAETAQNYNGVITYGELAAAIQRETGVRTNTLIGNWIGQRVLGEVARRCKDAVEPNLASLCVHQDGSIADGYGIGVEIAGEEAPANVEVHAAEQRLACYRFFKATDLPADGGTLKIIPRQRTSTKVKKRAPKVVAPQPKVCRTCHRMLSMSGRCDGCG